MMSIMKIKLMGWYDIMVESWTILTDNN
jgi:hypothetical protein